MNRGTIFEGILEINPAGIHAEIAEAQEEFLNKSPNKFLEYVLK